MVTNKNRFFLTIMLFALILGFTVVDGDTSPGIEGKKVVMIISSKNFRDEELQKPLSILKEHGARVTIACSSLKMAEGMLGAKVKPDILIKDVNVADFDAVVFVGGSGASEYWNDPIAHKIAREAFKQNKVLCAICIAPVTLANAGVLKGKKATVWSSEKDKIVATGAIYTGADVQVDGRIITANSPVSAKKFAEAIVNALAK
ncbi:MAG: DJ-1/PfpI family protein [Thermodesulfovibrionales bacterium]|nr:DJ-1/PfpI family protein [Thermodesulfovibrionales bacterium]